MKKLLFIALVAICGAFSVNAQTAKFGVKAGYTNITEKIKFDGGSISGSDSGFYVGGLVDITLDESFHIQPELIYSNAADVSFLYVPLLAKYYISDSGFQLMAGPQANFVLDQAPEGYNGFGLDLTFGVAYDIDEHFFIDVRYSFELTNRLKDGGEVDVTDKFQTLFVGLGYKF